MATDRQTRRRQDKAKKYYVIYRKKRTERPKVGGVSSRSRNSAPSVSKGCVVNGVVDGRK